MRLFPSINIGYSCGVGSQIIKTTNSCEIWFTLNLPVPNSNYYKNIFFIDNSTGYLTGNSGFFLDSSLIVKTINGGLNWNINYNFQSEFSLFLPIIFINANTGIVGGSQFLYKTTNDGQNWFTRNSATSNLITSLCFPSTTTGFGVCLNGDIINTTDAGKNWFRQYSSTLANLNTVYFINNLTGYICGMNGIVLKTTDGGEPPIGINPISSEYLLHT